MGRGQSVDRVVIGGGLFGCYAAISLADRGHQVVLIEQAPDLLTRASLVNQARLHSGLHYPRSFLTATEALRYYRQFRLRFPEAVRDFEQIYAVARHNSKTRGSDFSAFIERLGLYAEEIDPERWFHRGTVSRAFRVEEPSFDAGSLRDILVKELDSRPNVRVLVNKRMIAGTVGPDEVVIELDDGTFITGQRLVLSVTPEPTRLDDHWGCRPCP